MVMKKHVRHDRQHARPLSLEALESRRLFQATGWSTVIDNPLLPWTPGARYVYKGVKNGAPEKNVVVVIASYTRQVMGVTTTVVLDRVYESGKLTEKTHDYYAQDTFGNVWYFGEASRDLENGKVVSTEGSWEAGVKGARPGIIMQAKPNVGDEYRQEFATGVAADQAKVLTLNGRAKTPFAMFTHCLQTQESTVLEPGAVERKWFAAGVGNVRVQTVSGPDTEVVRLVSYVP